MTYFCWCDVQHQSNNYSLHCSMYVLCCNILYITWVHCVANSTRIFCCSMTYVYIIAQRVCASCLLCCLYLHRLFLTAALDLKASLPLQLTALWYLLSSLSCYVTQYSGKVIIFVHVILLYVNNWKIYSFHGLIPFRPYIKPLGQCKGNTRRDVTPSSAYWLIRHWYIPLCCISSSSSLFNVRCPCLHWFYGIWDPST